MLVGVARGQALAWRGGYGLARGALSFGRTIWNVQYGKNPLARAGSYALRAAGSAGGIGGAIGGCK